MINDYKNIYFNHADKYEQLVEKEDYEKNLFKTLSEITTFKDKRVIEFGAGTGRLTRQIATHCSHIRAFDFAPAMVALAAQKLASDNLKNWEVGVADNENIPAESACDISIAGWSFGHMTSWEPDSWKSHIQKCNKRNEKNYK
jgi:ubiquinone/menaquinone biosynthesis C-methylase UbiE